jgi:hypothetical protein
VRLRSSCKAACFWKPFQCPCFSGVESDMTISTHLRRCDSICVFIKPLFKSRKERCFDSWREPGINIVSNVSCISQSTAIPSQQRQSFDVRDNVPFLKRHADEFGSAFIFIVINAMKTFLVLLQPSPICWSCQ